MAIKPRSVVALAAIWVLAIAGVSATAWFAIDRAGRDLTNASMNSLAPAPMTTPTPGEQTEPAPTATSTPAPSVASPPSATTGPQGPGSPSTPPSTPTAQVRSVTVPGGQVTVGCVGTRIRLQVAQPENDWNVRVDTGSDQIEVTFRTGDDEEESRKTEVAAVCRRGIPDFDISD